MSQMRKWVKALQLQKIIALSAPVMLSTLLQSLFGTVDLIFIARIGTVEAAAASMSFSFFWMLIGLTGFVTAGTLAYVSRNVGRGDLDAMRRVIRHTDGMALIMSVVLSGLLLVGLEPIFRIIFNANDAVTKASMAYLSIILLGFPFVFLAANQRTALQATGQTFKPLVYFGIGNAINIILDPLLIFTFRMGIAGAAVATVIANAVTWALMSHEILKISYDGKLKNYFRTKLLPKADMVEILILGFWDTLQAIARPITGLLMFRIVFEAGKEVATAAFGIGGQLFNYTFIILSGLSVGLSVLTGQSLGEKNGQINKQLVVEGLLLAGLNMALFALPFTILSGPILGLFTKDPALISACQNYLLWIYPGLLFVIFPIILGGVLRGAGNTKIPMVASLVSNVVFKLPAALILSKIFYSAVNGVWLAIALSVVIEAGIILYFYQKGNWINEKI